MNGLSIFDILQFDTRFAAEMNRIRQRVSRCTSAVTHPAGGR